MEILYLWIDNFRSIKQQGFNFGGELKFSYDNQSGNLIAHENDLYVEGFWDNKIKNVTAIIGKNGSGKSTLLDFIKVNLSVDIGNTNLAYLCLFKENGTDEILIYNSTRKTVKLPKGLKLKFLFCENGRLGEDLVSLKFPTAFIFYSPIIEWSNDSEYIPLDISTTHLLHEIKPAGDNYARNDFDALRQREIHSQLQFASKYKEILPFSIPEELYMTPNPLSQEAVIAKISATQGKNAAEQLYKISEGINKELYELRGEKQQYYTEIYSSLFWHTVRYSIYNTPEKELTFLEEISDNGSKDYTWRLLKAIYSSPVTELQALPTLDDVEDLFNQLQNMEKNHIMHYFFNRFNFELRPAGNYQVIDSFIKSYFKMTIVGEFLNLFWSGLSSGEQSMFSIFARFYSIRPEIEKYLEGINNSRVYSHGMKRFSGSPDVVILLDEPEAHFHPQWQKDFIYTITKFLPDVVGSSKVQFILASNSPFLISDLPHYNVIFLDQIEGKTVVNDFQTSTFAANIHELLAQNFFLDSNIGKVAEEKVNEIINWLNQKQSLSVTQFIQINQIIKLIDDSLVKSKLLQMLSIKVGGENWEEYQLEQQQKLIEERLSTLRKGRRDA